MSSVTFLVSAVLTVCVLHAVDQTEVKPSIDKIDFSTQASNQVDKSVGINVKATKPVKSELIAPNASVYDAKKIENLSPSMQVTNKNMTLKNASAI